MERGVPQIWWIGPQAQPQGQQCLDVSMSGLEMATAGHDNVSVWLGQSGVLRGGLTHSHGGPAVGWHPNSPVGSGRHGGTVSMHQASVVSQ